ncbi:hypothetical protein KDW63_12230 [Burkholderia cenocepacia]|uniref:hypothetical protein n=1 Tax=Burkholderia cenocepacia TaxID=95486 RepID=UPI001B8ED337|nr:hypothetical protein [Burkholderia cenocepacia]MBR8294951.1 hypothetical protein [Burkholderia cenocepacia]
MLGEAIVEREKRAGGGNEYMYWSRAAATVPVANDAPAAAAAPTLTEAIAKLQCRPSARTTSRTSSQTCEPRTNGSPPSAMRRIDEPTPGARTPRHSKRASTS